MVRVIERDPLQSSSAKPAQVAGEPSPDHSPASSADVELPLDAAGRGCPPSRLSTTTRAATATRTRPASTSGSPTVAQRGGRPDGTDLLAMPITSGAVPPRPNVRALDLREECHRTLRALIPDGNPGPPILETRPHTARIGPGTHRTSGRAGQVPGRAAGSQ